MCNNVNDLIYKYKEGIQLTKDDKKIIYDNYTNYINNKTNLDSYEKNLILTHLKYSIIHNSKLYTLNELNLAIDDILRIAKEKEILSINLKRCMDNRHINVNELSHMLNIPYSTVNDWVNGVSYPRRDKLIRIAELFNINSIDLTQSHFSKNIIPVLGSIPARYPNRGYRGYSRL